MINTQIDLVTPEDKDGEGTAVWSGLLPELPAGGDTLEIRGHRTGTAQRPVDLYRVTGKTHWIVFAEDRRGDSLSVIVDVEPWTPDDTGEVKHDG